jgi:alkylation response protein AidB-like acyl-CoA dehydrogenase
MIEHGTAVREIAQQTTTRFGRFIAERINPGAEERDISNTSIPRAALEEAARLGLLTMSLPPDVGGEGVSPFVWGVVLEQVAYLCQDAAFPLVLMYADVARAIHQAGRPDLRERYVLPMARGERFGAFAYTEGRDPFSFATVIEPRGEGYVVNGWKDIITGGLMADVFMTYVRRQDGDLCVVLIERQDPGVTITPVPTMGLRAAGLASLRLTDVYLPRDRVLVPADGLGHIQRFLNQRRVFTASGFLGRMRALVEECMACLSATIRYGLPLTQFSNVQAALGRLYVAVHSSRVVYHDALKRLDGRDFDPLWDPVISAAKYYIGQQAVEAGQTILHLTGARGYLTGQGFERYARDVMGLIANAGAQDVLEVDLGVSMVSEWERRQDLRAKGEGR